MLGVPSFLEHGGFVTGWMSSPDARELRNSIDWSLANIADDQQLRARLEGMATTELFRAHAWFWAPKLYARNRAIFRPFITQNFAEHYVTSEARPRWERVDYAGDVAKSLDPWLAVLERDGETALFRRIYAWKHRLAKGWSIDEQAWQKDLRQAFLAATPAGRAKVLDLYNQNARMGEDLAIALYEADRELSEPFILRHLPGPTWIEKKWKHPLRWKRLESKLRNGGNDAFAWKIYRRQVEVNEWIDDALAQCKALHDPEVLNQALENRHPETIYGDLGPQFHRLMEARGLEILPYVRRHLRNVYTAYRKSGFDEMAALARKRGWTDFWIALHVICANPKEYNAALASVLADKSLLELERVRRLELFSGVSREWNGLGWGLARVQMLDGNNALELYRRYRTLLTQRFKAHVTPHWNEDYRPLFELAWSEGDEDTCDYLASRYLTQLHVRRGEKINVAELAADKYAGLKLDEDAFARRAANVLTLVPAYSIYLYDRLVQMNRFARLLFERSLRGFLAVPSAVRDLVEGSEIHVQTLAYRSLALRDPRAEALARDNLDILIGTVLRPLHRGTRVAAFGALRNAASTEDCARRVLGKCREAFALPDRRYPKEALVGLMADILARFPALAGTDEKPVVYRRVA